MTSKQPVFIAVFKPTRMIARTVPNREPPEMDHVVHIAYDSTGQRWGFVERIANGPGMYMKPYRAPKYTARGWVKLPTQILDEIWEDSP